MSSRGPLGLRVPLSRPLARASALAVALSCGGLGMAVAAGGRGVEAHAPARTVAVVVVVAMSVAVIAGVALAMLGPWSARIVTALTFAFAGVAGATALGVAPVGGSLAPTLVVLVAAVALVHHLLASPELDGGDA
ncbi:hypothetical protein GCM10009846_05090 [Agrococcus versicolor]|uniref:Histidine kinase n=1 Tax=Agrococcus versicolor TaxID=501482 RepID=A0ABN3AK70_9MICO